MPAEPSSRRAHPEPAVSAPSRCTYPSTSISKRSCTVASALSGCLPWLLCTAACVLLYSRGEALERRVEALERVHAGNARGPTLDQVRVLRSLCVCAPFSGLFNYPAHCLLEHLFVSTNLAVTAPCDHRPLGRTVICMTSQRRLLAFRDIASPTGSSDLHPEHPLPPCFPQGV